MKLDFVPVQPDPRPVREWTASAGDATVTVNDCGGMWSCRVDGPMTLGLGDSVKAYRNTRDQAVEAAFWLARQCGMVAE